MNITALTSTGQQTRTIERPRLLLRVMAWELRRFCASRLFWLQALGFFCFLLFLTWAMRMPDQFTIGIGGPNSPMFYGFVAGTSAWGLLETLPFALLLLGLLLPFVTADGVTRDLHRRTHELLMTTALPSWAYVWGRYLVSLLLALGLALLSLAAILGMGELSHLTVANYPAPEIGTVLLLWVGMVLPATILLSSLSFALGTLLPRLSTLVKIVILLAWFVGALILPLGLHATTTLPAWYVNWDPTSAVTAIGLRAPYQFPGNQAQTATSVAQLQQLLLGVENKLPSIAGWFAPHLIEALLSFLLVVLAAFAFQRFRNAFNG
jgi:ABC-type transport system involved in multi-copper enzyme maturation permease subunit